MSSIETLRAVHHPTRRRIIEHLAVYGAAQVTTLARELGEQVGSISHHLRMLERVEMVQRAPELATDGRTSWWRRTPNSTVSWSVDDFADSPADRMTAKAAERLNLDYQLGKLAAWKNQADRATSDWKHAAFSSDTSASATAQELSQLQDLLAETLRAWRDAIDIGDGAERRPVFIFTHGFPTRP